MKALVPTCNRPELFSRLVSKLDGFDVIGFVNNTTGQNMLRYSKLDLPDNVKLVYPDIHGEPKQCHVDTFRMMLTHADSDCLIIEDDLFPCDHFHDELMKRVLVLKNLGKEFTLSPIYLPYRNSDFYTGGKSRRVRIGTFGFVDQAWVDGNFFMTSGVLESMKLWLHDIKIYGVSSGVGRRNSKEIAIRGWRMYTAIPTLAEHLDHDSVMFPDHRKQVPLISRFGVI